MAARAAEAAELAARAVVAARAAREASERSCHVALAKAREGFSPMPIHVKALTGATTTLQVYARCVRACVRRCVLLCLCPAWHVPP